MKKSTKKDYKVTIKIFQNGQLEKTIKTDDVLESFNEIKLDPKTLKGGVRIEAEYGDKKYFHNMYVRRMRLFLTSPITRQIMAKHFNIALGI